ncbi:MAG: AIR synthase related protein, partial [Spirochaetota bacterium]
MPDDKSPRSPAQAPRSYAEAGVDIDRGEAVPRILSAMASKAVSREIGGFAGGVPIDLSGYSEPRLLSTTDGVGSKILLARDLGDYSTIGIDLVAMCVNDLAVCGCSPSLFLD